MYSPKNSPFLRFFEKREGAGEEEKVFLPPLLFFTLFCADSG